jgi:parvulin-like peptidyl-prolyl isomerase
MTCTDASSVRNVPPPAWRRPLGLSLVVISIIAAAIALRYWTGDEPAAAQVAAQRRPATRTAAAQPQVSENDAVAVVNGQKITRKALVDACVQRHGEEVLESMCNKHLIQYHCQKRGIQVTQAEVEAEVDRMAKRFKLDRKQWLDLLVSERGITPEQYARDIVWPTVALRKLASSRMEVQPEELKKAYETQFGPAVRARLIVVSDPQLAAQIQARAAASPDEFARLAIDHSEDINSASIGGLIQPVRRHVGDTAVERAVFALQPGQVSSVIQVGNQYAILKCEEHIPARSVPLSQVQDELGESIREEKLREEANKLFSQYQQTATIKNVYNDPQMSKQMPGVVATVNGDRVLYRQLGEECYARHAEAVLQIEISHALLRQALAGQRLQVTQEDLNAEIAHAATLSGIVTAQGQPDLAKWMEMATSEAGITRDQYMRDSVWPSVALKKLTGDEVQVTEDDLRKAFEANYGEKVRCQAIVLADHRRAKEVWDMARQNPTEEAFGELAAEFSIEPSTKSLRGEVPPIRKHGGREQLETAAFSLTQPGQLSGIIQLGDHFVILRYLGRTEPLDVQFEAVRQILHQDLYEKKLRIAMSQRFEKLQQSAHVENLLTGDTQTPAQQAAAAPAARTSHRDAAVRPTATTSTARQDTVRR